MVERRRIKRLEIPIPVSIKMLGADPFHAETRKVSLELISTELPVIVRNGNLSIQDGGEPKNLIPLLTSNEKLVELDIKIPPKGEVIRATGRVIWYDFGSRGASYYFRAGIFLEKMGFEDRKRWANFVRNMAEVHDKGTFSN